MKKTLSIMLVVLFALSLMGTVFAAPDDIFKDVPANHWSYAAVKKLAKAGIVGGYGDGTFRGSATISRYEMAIIVANAMTKSENADAESKELINKLASEYANEMQRIGARVDRLEAYNKSTLRVGADALMTFASDQPAANLSSIKGDEAFMWRVRFWFSGDLNDKTKFLARIATGYGNLGNSIATSTPSVAFSNTMVADVAQFTFSDVLGLDTLKLGRQAVNELGGNVLQRTGSDDGIAISKKIGDNTTIRAGAFVIRANNSTSTAFDAQELQYASLTAKVNDGISLGGMFVNNNSTVSSTVASVGYGGSKIKGVSTTVKLPGGWTFLTEYDMANLKNPSANCADPNPHACAFQITSGTAAPGSFFLVPQTMCNINKPGDSAWTLAYHFVGSGVIPSGHSSWRNGTGSSYSWSPNFIDNVKGWAIDYQYTLLKGLAIDFTYQKLQYAQSIGTAKAGDKLDDILAIALQYRY